MSLTAKQVAELEKPLNKAVVRERTQSGQTLSYIEGWHAIAEANRIFGFDGWQRETIDMREVRHAEQVQGKRGMNWRVGYLAKVRVTVGDIVREGTGFGSGAMPDLGDAIESAIKEAETDAMKRALMTFGNPFGLALYDKTRENVVSDDAPLSVAPQKRSQRPAQATPFDDEPDEVLNELRRAAMNGTAEIRDAWGSLSKPEKDRLKSHLDELRSVAAQADQARAA